MALAALTNRAARYVIIRSVGAKHNGFFIRNRRFNIKPGYEILGYANNNDELRAILFPN
jgi:hypothetical protein